jgi:hypothetical protein
MPQNPHMLHLPVARHHPAARPAARSDRHDMHESPSARHSFRNEPRRSPERAAFDPGAT